MSDLTVWGVIAGLAGATFLIRYSFLGLMGGRVLPDWLRLALSFVPVTVLPALAAPMVLFGADGGWAGSPVLLAAGATVLVGILTRSLLGAFGTGMLVYHMAEFAGLSGL